MSAADLGSRPRLLLSVRLLFFMRLVLSVRQLFQPEVVLVRHLEGRLKTLVSSLRSLERAYRWQLSIQLKSERAVLVQRTSVRTQTPPKVSEGVWKLNCAMMKRCGQFVVHKKNYWEVDDMRCRIHTCVLDDRKIAGKTTTW